MHTKILAVLLVLLAVGYSTAPAWVASGVSLNYSVGNDMVTFSVLNRTSTDIHFQIYTHSTNSKAFPDENASGYSGQVWFDESLLASASTGSSVDGYSVTDESQQTFADTSWDTITLQGTVSGAVTTYVYDKKTGLLLKQTAAAQGAPEVILVQYYIPALAPPPVAPPQANNTQPAPVPTENATTPGTGGNGTASTGGNNGTTQPPANETQAGQPSGSGASTVATPKTKPCCLSALFILLAVGLVTLRNRA